MSDVTLMPIWIEERAVAKRWGVSIYTVQRERKRGRLKAKRLGGRWKYRSDWLREYEDEATPCQSNSGCGKGLSGISVCEAGLSVMRADEALVEDDGELGLGLEPFARRPFPLLGRVVQDQE